MPGPEENLDSFTIKLEEDDEGNLVFPFPDELLDSLNWSEGDVLEIYAVHKQIVFRKVEDRAPTVASVEEQD
jgi:bifunctional DNA-binding transcriptional regulator/antitoxin component of YhaV-PrlF toxin-antitoxin module